MLPKRSTALGIGYSARVISAHRTPERLFAFAKGARAEGFELIIAGAGGAAHLPGMTAAMTTLPVFGVPVESKALSGRNSLLSIVQMPAGVPVGTLAIGKAGAINAALLAASVLALHDASLRERLEAWRAAQTASVPELRLVPTLPVRTERYGSRCEDRSRRYDRHSRRRPAWPHVGTRRGEARLAYSRVRTRAGARFRRRGGAHDRRLQR